MTVSPPVSPSVVAAILMIQKARVTSGTLLNDSGISLSHSTSQGTFICPIFLRCLNVQFAANVLERAAVTQSCDSAVGADLGIDACIENSPNSFWFDAVNEFTFAGSVVKIF